MMVGEVDGPGLSSMSPDRKRRKKVKKVKRLGL